MSSGAASARGGAGSLRLAMVDHAALAANDSTSRTEDQLRWVSGQCSESNSKGKGHCGLIKAIFP